MQPSRVVQVDQVALVFGMEWVPLLGETTRVSSLARRSGASHRTVSGEPPAALGMAQGISRRKACWSAAALMAHGHPTGTLAWLFVLDADSWHVLACHEGVALVRADRSYPDRELAYRAVEALRVSYPHLEFLDATLRDGATEDRDVLRMLARESKSVPALHPVRRLFGMGVWVLVLTLVIMFAAGRFWWVRPVAQDAEQVARVSWERALADAVVRRPIHGTEGTRDLLAVLYRQPFQLAGWRLQTLRCEPKGVERPWQCHGEYRRVLPHADNRGLMQAAPADWRLDFPSLDRALVRWSLSLASSLPDLGALPSSQVLERDWASALQDILPAFSKLQLEPARALSVTVPRDAQGRDLPRPESLQVPVTRVLRVQAPLQSISLLVPLARPVSWQKAVLTVAPAARAGLRTGRLILHLEGVVYENA
ncbi:MAG TPA: hypothetical protein VF285_02615 [Castellaniella sp.]|uniref:hypothetical protein n=1 Tax=Castellaniella sp. TaxID=1955812 RepID=UPI002EE6ACAB